jgi:hypothetical protein
VRRLEVLSRVAPLGVRFRDEVTGALVGDGLQVSAFPEGQPTARRASIVNRSGVHVLMDLPGLRDLEFGGKDVPPQDAGDAAWWASLPTHKPFTVEVEDAMGRFLPCSFRAQLPFPGLFQLDCPGVPPASLPPTGGPAVPLFSAPARAPGGPLAVLRAELWDADAQVPAAWALVEATPEGGAPVRGVADEQGRLALFFQYPAPVDFPPGSFADASALPAGPPLLEQSWALHVRVFYARRTPVPARPDLCDTLSQPSSWAWTDTGSSVELLEPTLRYGQELVLRTQDAPRSRLWITSTGSLP